MYSNNLKVLKKLKYPTILSELTIGRQVESLKIAKWDV